MLGFDASEWRPGRSEKRKMGENRGNGNWPEKKCVREKSLYESLTTRVTSRAIAAECFFYAEITRDHKVELTAEC
jgi:hypothetical protein